MKEADRPRPSLSPLTASAGLASLSAVSDTTIDLLATAVMSTAKGVRGRTLYIGWNGEALPAARTRVEDLSPAARESLAAYRAAGLGVRKVPFTELVPVNYVLTGPAIDFTDSGGRVAEDQIRYTFLDGAEERREIPLGELGVLRGITLARHPWQSMVGRSTDLAVSAVPLYSVFTTIPGASASTGLAILFEPTVRGSTNEPAFRSFVRNTIGRLLVLDESQPAEKRRGYLEVAGRVAGVPPKGGLAGMLVAMRRMGFVEFEDRWLERFRGRGQRWKGGFIRALARDGHGRGRRGRPGGSLRPSPGLRCRPARDGPAGGHGRGDVPRHPRLPGLSHGTVLRRIGFLTTAIPNWSEHSGSGPLPQVEG